MGIREKLVSLLGNNVNQVQAAAAVGCSPSYVSELMRDSEFMREVSELRVANLTANTIRDSKYDALEDRALDNLSTLIDSIYDPIKLAVVLSKLNMAKRRGSSAQDSSNIEVTQVVTLALPQALSSKLQLSINNEVQAVADRELVTIEGVTLLNDLKGKTQNDPRREANRRIFANETGPRFLEI